ncbi:hypothetical protein BC828DRAFT_134962 [Blastocladiella britannica]|nr:hypothetical protein BC828DRAFT_134962 [Blastocladiella britannica]
MATTAKHMSPLLESTLDGLAPLSEATTLNASHMSGLDKEKERSSPAGAAAASTTTTTDGAGAEIPCYFRIDPVPENPGDLKVLDPAKLPDGSPAPAPLLAAGMFRPSSIEDLRGSTLLFGLAFLVWLGSAVFGAGLAGALVVAWAFVHYHDMSNEKLVNKLRLEAEYNASRRRAQLGTEDADWFNMILGKFWLAYEPTLSSTIQASLDPILEWVCPSFIDSMTFSTFTLGTFPPQLRNIIHARHQPDDIVDFQFDLALGAFGPRTAASNAAAAATAGAGVSASDVALDEQPTGGDSAVAVGSNVRVDLVVRIKGIGATVRAENVTLEGRMRIRMKLMTAFPHVKVLELWFLEAPKVDFQLRPLGGFDMNGFSGFRKWLSETISWGISTNLVWPVPLVIPLDDWFNHPSAEANASIGVLVVHIKSAQGLKNADLIGKSDPFVKISLAGQTVAKTVVIHNNLNPFWDVIKYIPISKLKEADLKLGVYDYDKGLRSKLLGYAPVNISSLDAAKGGALPQAEFDLADSENRPAGKMYASVSFYPVADPLAVPQSLPAAADAAAPVAAAAAAATTATLNPQNGPTAGAAAAAAAQATVAAPPVPAECPSGLLKVYCHAARGIETGSKLRSSFVEVAFNGENAYTTRIKKHSNTPLWEESFEVFVPDFKTAKLNFKLKEDVNKTVAGIAGIGGGDRSADGLLGQTTLAVADVLKTNLKEDWWALSDAVTREAKIRVTMKWRPVPLRADSTNISVGVLRVRVLQCYDLKATMAKINPYVRLVRGGKTRAQSRRLVDTANPSFDESLFSLIRDKDEQIQLQVWDYTRGLKDTMVGAATLDLSNYILEDPETGAMSSRGIEKDELRLTLQDPTKSRGRMAVEISFHPKNPAMPFSPESPDVCGVVKVNVHQLKDLPRKTSSYFEIYADDPNLPLYRSNTRKKTSDPIFEQTTEIFIRQVLWSPIHIVFREDSGANAAEAAITAGGGADSAAAMPSKRSDSKSNPVIGAVELFCYNVVSEALGEEKWYPMTSSGASTKAKLSFDFVPVECAIDSSESLGNMGLLTVEVVGARDLPKTDQVGSCDPFVVVLLNDARWFRTEVFKKNRNPVWKERVKIPVLDRRHSWLKLDVYDWDRVGDNDRIGGVELNLANIPVDEQMTIELPVDERGDRGFVTFSYRFEAQRMDKVPSRAMTLARGALDRLDPRCSGQVDSARRSRPPWTC